MTDDATLDSSRPQPLKWGLFDDYVGPPALLLSNALTSRSLAALRPFGLPPGSLSVLTLIQANPGCSQMDIARTTGMSKSGVVGLLDELESRGFAKRTRSRNDRRRYKLTLTAEGEAEFQRMAAAQVAQEEAIRNEFDAEELRLFIQMLRRAYKAIENEPLVV